VNIRIKRVYEVPLKDDGTRVLVDRLWPRGLTKEKARVDVWLKDIAPSSELREWFGHDPKKWTEFQKRYGNELDANVSIVNELKDLLSQGSVTLVYGAKDEQHNDAVVLKAYLER
jgi:uncharacterized protein YeaO (DUF488 family)